MVSLNLPLLNFKIIYDRLSVLVSITFMMFCCKCKLHETNISMPLNSMINISHITTHCTCNSSCFYNLL